MGKQKYNENVELLFVYTDVFNKIWKYYGLSEKDKKRFEKLVREYEENNTDPSNVLGDIIADTGGAIKLRFDSSSDNVGKSGGYRIIYSKYGRRVYAMLLIYKKSDKETLTDKEKSIIKNRVKDLKKNQ
ncbi:hypothetical protein [Planococcus sp. S3-L1]|uniref:hypothetical protein n=1 Tax=Planococcus sp. S3-L1 TaxID=3046200 RepID=UPI0024BA354B|nr:hypothetical protein [Planococcus sp. S3-L1]MDJ0333427.1 hypothetical protein [Planococcus sp. S3-L1]